METWFPTFRRFFGTRVPLPSLWPPYTTAWQRRSLLRLIAVALEDNLPLVPLLESWTQDERGAQKSRLRRLIGLLKSGRPLADAIEEVPGILRDEDVLALRFDTHSGTRTAAVRSMLDEQPLETSSQLPRLRRPFIYLCMFVPIFLFFFAFNQLRIVPVFHVMLSQFGMPRPAVLGWSASFGNTLLNYWWVFPLVAIALAWSMFSTRGGRFVRHSVLGRWFTSRRQMHAGDLLQHLGVAVQAGRPVPGALSTLARYHFDPATRHQLLFLRNEVEQGAELWASMQAVGLLTSPEVRLLKTADRVGNRPWVLKQLAQIKKRRAYQRSQRTTEFLLPLVVIVMGGFVLFQSLTVLQPLTQMIDGWL